MIDKQGHLIRLFKLKGLDFQTLTATELDSYKNRRNSFFKQLDSRFALYHWMNHQVATIESIGAFNQDFAQQLQDNYIKQFKAAPLFQTEHYLGLVIKPPLGAVNQISQWFKRLSMVVDKQEREAQQQAYAQALEEISHKLLNQGKFTSFFATFYPPLGGYYLSKI